MAQEQLSAQYIEQLLIPWNSPIFVILKILKVENDNRSVSKVILPMDSLQPEIPLSSLLTKGWSIIVIDLKDCFFLLYLYKNRIEKNFLLIKQNKQKTVPLTVILNLLEDVSGGSYLKAS